MAAVKVLMDVPDEPGINNNYYADYIEVLDALLVLKKEVL